jgi:hypothetical protein
MKGCAIGSTVAASIVRWGGGPVGAQQRWRYAKR